MDRRKKAIGKGKGHDAEVRGFAGMVREMLAKEERIAAQAESRGYSGRPKLRKWDEQRGTSSN